MQKKWRPALWMVVFGTLIIVALLPLMALAVLLGLESWFDIKFQLRSLSGFVTLGLGSVLMAAMIGVVFLRTLLRPWQHLIARTGEIELGTDNAFRPLQHVGTAEGAMLATRFFAMARKLSDRSNHLTLFTSHLNHELKTPLTSIQGAAELLMDGEMEEQKRKQFLTNIMGDTARLSRLSTRLRELARAEEVTSESTSNLLSVLEQSAVGSGLKLNASFAPRSLAMSEENALILFRQLTENAVQNCATTFTVGEAEGRLLVGDDGAAILQSDREQLLTPFFTTRGDEGGTGMGLAIATAMLKNHGGYIELSERADWKFEIQLEALAAKS